MTHDCRDSDKDQKGLAKFIHKKDDFLGRVFYLLQVSVVVVVVCYSLQVMFTSPSLPLSFSLPLLHSQHVPVSGEEKTLELKSHSTKHSRGTLTIFMDIVGKKVSLKYLFCLHHVCVCVYKSMVMKKLNQ